MSFWLISVPNNARADPYTALNAQTQGLAKNHVLKVPDNLKVGTLDSLMALSDDLAKQDQYVGAIAKKIEKTYIEMWKAEAHGDDEKKQAQTQAGKQADANPPELRIGQASAQEYVEAFQWNEVRYPKRSPLRQLTELIVKEASKSDEALKKQVAEYNEVRTSFSTIERKDTGSLLVKPLGPYVKQGDIVETSHLTTLMVVVPRVRQQEWVDVYEVLEDEWAVREKEEAARKAVEAQERSKREEERREAMSAEDKKKADQRDSERKSDDVPAGDDDKKSKKLPCRAVVPRSAKILSNENNDEFILYRVIVLKDGAEQYKNLLREKRLTVRPFKYDPEEDRLEAERKVELGKKKKSLWNFLLRWCSTTYAEVFSAWLHLKAIRVYVESVLRYGLPVDFKAMLLEPYRGKEKQLRAVLKQLYGTLAGSNANLTTQLDPNEPDLSGLGADFYPYVYLPLSLID